MAVTSKHPQEFVRSLYRGEHQFDGSSAHTFKVALLNTSFSTFSVASANSAVWDASSASTLAGYEITAAGGYAAASLASVTVSINSSGSIVINCANVNWTASTSALDGTKAAAVYNDTHASKQVVACIEFGATYTTAAGTTFQINFASGLMKGIPNP